MFSLFNSRHLSVKSVRSLCLLINLQTIYHNLSPSPSRLTLVSAYLNNLHGEGRATLSMYKSIPHHKLKCHWAIINKHGAEMKKMNKK